MMKFNKFIKKQTSFKQPIDDNTSLYSTEDQSSNSFELYFKQKEQLEPSQSKLFLTSEKAFGLEPEPKHINAHTCGLCLNKNNIKDSFMILTCGHIFHIKCLAEQFDSDIIDEGYFNSKCCIVCHVKMEIEDILYIHNKFYKNTMEYISKHEKHIDILDKQLTRLKDELRTSYEYKQRLEHQREKSKQIIVTINTLL